MHIEIEKHNGFPSNLGFMTFLKYFPPRFQVETKYKSNRTVVYNFKDGVYNNMVDALFINYINSMLNTTQKSNHYFCIIPSSSILGTQNRFYSFCNRVSNNSGINNGYSLIQPSENRPTIHGSDHRDYSKVISSLNFNSIAGKNILLCDDVITTGKSYRLIANHLMSLGALSVRGLMLAKTHWLSSENIHISSLEEGVLPDEEPPSVPPDLEYREPMDNFFI